MKALFLNCTLTKSPGVSNTEALIKKCEELYHSYDVETEVIRLVDYTIPFGIKTNMGDGDDFPEILEKIKAADIIVVGTPIWFGVRSSVTQLLIERLDGTYGEGDEETGQFPLYGKVAGAVVTGNEDGAHDAAATTLFNLSHLGCVVPPNADCYWVGDAGPGPSYIEAEGDKHMYTNKTARFMVHNTVALATMLKKTPLDTNLKKLTKDAQDASNNTCPEDMS